MHRQIHPALRHYSLLAALALLLLLSGACHRDEDTISREVRFPETIQLASADLAGSVQLPDGSPAAEALVEVLAGDEVAATASVGVDGRWELDNVETPTDGALLRITRQGHYPLYRRTRTGGAATHFSRARLTARAFAVLTEHTERITAARGGLAVEIPGNSLRIGAERYEGLVQFVLQDRDPSTAEAELLAEPGPALVRTADGGDALLLAESFVFIDVRGVGGQDLRFDTTASAGFGLRVLPDFQGYDLFRLEVATRRWIPVARSGDSYRGQDFGYYALGTTTPYVELSARVLDGDAAPVGDVLAKALFAAEGAEYAQTAMSSSDGSVRLWVPASTSVELVVGDANSCARAVAAVTTSDTEVDAGDVTFAGAARAVVGRLLDCGGQPYIFPLAIARGAAFDSRAGGPVPLEELTVDARGEFRLTANDCDGQLDRLSVEVRGINTDQASVTVATATVGETLVLEVCPNRYYVAATQVGANGARQTTDYEAATAQVNNQTTYTIEAVATDEDETVSFEGFRSGGQLGGNLVWTRADRVYVLADVTADDFRASDGAVYAFVSGRAGVTDRATGAALPDELIEVAFFAEVR